LHLAVADCGAGELSGDIVVAGRAAGPGASAQETYDVLAAAHELADGRTTDGAGGAEQEDASLTP